MKVLADVNVSRRVVEALRAAGIDIVRVPEIMDIHVIVTNMNAGQRRPCVSRRTTASVDTHWHA